MDKVRKNQKGKVFLVGAGPGDPELITQKAKRILGFNKVLKMFIYFCK